MCLVRPLRPVFKYKIGFDRSCTDIYLLNDYLKH